MRAVLLFPGNEAYIVKADVRFPGVRPALRGVICQHGGAGGELPALPDSAGVAGWRTGPAAALGTQVSARPAVGESSA
ncbi:hypothetical protein CTZ28_33205 [Streptomyces shenzhenensis]|uniref:Uncharacterized protein n=1 Tax=Streptomyces shenzhenensis TaxID=943815 RepID=A0A3M0I4Q9_9ACTN|nr:hypothetical protein CTZ28_33205 [Streptomyces shenzhenensis]